MKETRKHYSRREIEKLLMKQGFLGRDSELISAVISRYTFYQLHDLLQVTRIILKGNTSKS
jgi:hypothetical protein